MAALLVTALHTAMVQSNRTVLLLSLSTFICLALTQAICWVFTYPMNVASNNWTVMPENFEASRRQWEYSHAVSAVLTFVAFVAMTFAVAADKRSATGTDHVG